MDTDLDLRQLEKASESIDRLIESREAANLEASATAESLERYNLAQARELRQQWAAYYRHRVQLYEDLAAESRTKLLSLMDE